MKRFFNSCRRHRPRICLLASGTLYEPERNAVETHLGACADCQKYYAEIEAMTKPLANLAKSFAQLQPNEAAQARWAKAIQMADRPGAVRPFTPAMAVLGWWRDVISPCRRIWAGLAAVWVIILMGHFSLREHSPMPVAKSSSSSQQMIMALKDRQNILAELLADHSAPRDADRQKFFLPKPRTEYVKVLAA